ncbi:hypothetical protein Ancab_037237 [Ancistrocladus abbreviatus]
MRLSINTTVSSSTSATTKPFKPYTCNTPPPPSPPPSSPTTTKHFKQQQVSFQHISLTQQLSFNPHHSLQPHSLKNLKAFSHQVGSDGLQSPIPPGSPIHLGCRWMEYQGARDWDGLLDPLDDRLRYEILRYGNFVEAAYRAFDFNPSSPGYGMCRFRRKDLLRRSGFLDTGYQITKNLRSTSGIRMPHWADGAPRWVGMQSSWIGYVAVCHDKEAIARLGRRDVVIAFRGTATCLEWFENLRATLTHFADHTDIDGSEPMVESGFLSLYTSSTTTSPSLQEMVRREISRILETYKGENLSFTITGHSLGAALATLAAYDIKTTFEQAPLVTVISFGGPRVGNQSFRTEIEKQGAKILRIVNPDDLITKIPGFVVHTDDDDMHKEVYTAANVRGWPRWLQRRVADEQWAYAEVGCELRLGSTPLTTESPPQLFNNMNVVKCHDLKTYLHLVESFVGSTCPLRATARRLLRRNQEKVFPQKALLTSFDGGPNLTSKGIRVGDWRASTREAIVQVPGSPSAPSTSVSVVPDSVGFAPTGEQQSGFAPPSVVVADAPKFKSGGNGVTNHSPIDSRSADGMEIVAGSKRVQEARSGSVGAGRYATSDARDRVTPIGGACWAQHISPVGPEGSIGVFPNLGRGLEITELGGSNGPADRPTTVLSSA